MSGDRPTRRRFLVSAALTTGGLWAVTGTGGPRTVTGSETPTTHGVEPATGSGGMAAGSGSARSGTAEEWPTFAADSSNSSTTASRGPASGVSRGWTADRSPTTPPVVVGGVVYVGTESGVVALEADGGEHVWTAGTDSPVRTTPAVVGTTVYAGSDEGVVYAVRSTSGDRLWRFDAGEAVRAPPAADPERDHLFVASKTGTVYRLDALAGNVNWERSLGGSVDSALALRPARETLFVPVAGTVRGLDVSGGGDRWTFEAGGSSVCAPAVGKPHLFVADDGETLYEVDPRNGRERWSRSLAGRVREALAFLGEEVYVATDAGHVYAFDTDVNRHDDRASEQWHVELGSSVTTAPALSRATRTLYIPTADGTVRALGIAGGDERWSARLSVGTPSIAVAGRSIYAAGDGIASLDSGSKTAITTRTPTPERTPGSTPTSPPEPTPTPTPTVTVSPEPTPTPTPAATASPEPTPTRGSTPTPARRTLAGTPTATPNSSGVGATTVPATPDESGPDTTSVDETRTSTESASGPIPPWFVAVAVGGLGGYGALRATERSGR